MLLRLLVAEFSLQFSITFQGSKSVRADQTQKRKEFLYQQLSKNTVLRLNQRASLLRTFWTLQMIGTKIWTIMTKTMTRNVLITQTTREMRIRNFVNWIGINSVSAGNICRLFSPLVYCINTGTLVKY